MPIINRDIFQGDPEWFAARLGKPSASNASRLVTSTGAPSKSMQAYAEELAGDKFAGQAVNQWSGNGYTEFGNEMEEEARLAYELETGQDVEQVAFIEDDLQRVIISPDGLVGDNGLVEIKNLPKKHISSLLYYDKNGKPPTDYIAQVQLQLLVSERAYCDLFYYSNLLPTLCIRIEPDQKIFAALRAQITAVLMERDRIIKTLEKLT